MKTWLLNNCNNLDHVKVYRHAHAFFDLWTDDVKNRRMKDMAPGDRCFVLSQDSAKRIIVDEFRFSEHFVTQDSEYRERSAWVLCGQFIRGEKMSRLEALDHPTYRYFFNSLDHLNQWSIIQLDTSHVAAAA